MSMLIPKRSPQTEEMLNVTILTQRGHVQYTSRALIEGRQKDKNLMADVEEYLDMFGMDY